MKRLVREQRINLFDVQRRRDYAPDLGKCGILPGKSLRGRCGGRILGVQLRVGYSRRYLRNYFSHQIEVVLLVSAVLERPHV